MKRNLLKLDAAEKQKQQTMVQIENRDCELKY
jgi:hypothetical protein